MASPAGPRDGTRAEGDGAAPDLVGRLSRIALLVLPLAVLAERAWSRRWISDDGFINLRIVDQLLAGNGPVFNVGERVEASTSALWVYLLAAADVLAPLRSEWVAVLLGIALTVGGVGLATMGAARLWSCRVGTHLLVPAGALVLVAMTPVWTFSSSGLEGGLSFTWLGACLWLLARWATGERLGAGTAVLLGLGPLIRPDLGLLTVLFAVVVIVGRWSGDDWRSRGRFLALLVAVPAAYQLFRMGYYGSLVPNPAVAKEASRSSWDQGLRYLRETVNPYGLWFPLAAVVVGGYVPLVRRLGRESGARVGAVALAFAIGGLLHAAFVTRVGGDFMHARLLLPSLFALVAPVAVVPVRRETAPALLAVPWAVVALLFLRASADDIGEFASGQLNLVTVDDFGWGEDGPNRAWFTGEGVYYVTTRLDAEPAPGHGEATVAMLGLGIGSYALGPDVYVLDLLGLADPFTAHLELDRRGIVGHEKPLPPPWTVARTTAPGAAVDPDLLALPTAFGVRPLDDPDRAPFGRRVAVAREVLECREVRRLLAAADAPLTMGRFFDNVLDSFSLTRLRIPPEPEDARRELCR